MNKKIIIITTIISLIIIVTIISTGFYLTHKDEIKERCKLKVYTESDYVSDKVGRLIKVAGKLYYDTGEESKIEARCGVMDGKITSHVDSKYIPTEDNQSNFEGDYEYQYGEYGTIDVVIDGKWITFKPQNQSIDFSDDNLKIELIENKKNKELEYYKNSDNQKIYLVGFSEIYLNDGNNKATLKEYIEKEGLTIDQSINYITNKIEYVTGLYDGGTTIYRDGGTTSTKVEQNKISNTGFKLIRCNHSIEPLEKYNTDVYIGPLNLNEQQGFEDGYCGH